MAASLSLEPLVFLREHAHGACYGFPLADPSQRARGSTAEETLEELRHFLSKFFGRCPAERIADYLYPPDTTLLDLPVVLPRGDLARRLRVQTPVCVPCVVIPEGRSRWVYVVPLAHAVLVKPTEDLSRRVTEEIERMAAARELDAVEYLDLLPTSNHRLVRLAVTVEREDADDASRRAATRRREQSERERKQARTLLKSVGKERVAAHRGQHRGALICGRDHEIQTLASLLGGRERLSVVLVGEPLVGKSSIVEGLLSQRVVRFSARPVFATSGAQMVAGQSGFGQLEQRVEAVLNAAEMLDAVLYFDDLGDLFAGQSGGIEDIASMMRPWIVDGRVRVVGELTPEVLEHHIKRHVAFFAALQRISVEPLDAAATREILGARIAHEAKAPRHDRPRLRPESVEPLVQLSERYLSYQAFPGKAVRLGEELRAVHEGEVDEDGQPRAIGPHDVYRAFSVRSGIPMFLLRDEQRMRYEQVLDHFSRRIIGQREALERLARALCAVKAGLQPQDKPLANLLFVGPTGVGKTEVAKTLALFLFGDTGKMVRFDMSEYGDPFASERLIRGTEREEGELTRRVRQQPFCVVLLDEIEKADPAVFDLLLQVLGEGRLSDARGRTTWFHNCIVIMTSNLGASHRRPRSGFAADDEAEQAEQQFYVEQVERHFRPEFVNRLDGIVPFSPLGGEQIAQVARVALRGLLEREGLATRGIDLRVSDQALDELARGGVSDAYGARALRRHLEDELVAPVARLVAEAGADADGAVIEVTRLRAEAHADAHAEAPEATSSPGLVAKIQTGALELTLTRRSSHDERRSSLAVRDIARLRRIATACRALEPIDELQERMAYLVAELARARDYSHASPATQVAEHARLQEGLRALDEAIEEIEGAEDLAMVAQAEAEPSDLYVEEATRAFAGFERAFVQAALGGHAIDQITLLVRGHSTPRCLAWWLRGLLSAVKERGWRIVVHRWEDRQPVPPWPEALPWGPPRDLPWVKQALDKAEPDEIAKAWRGVLVRVSGPLAGSLLHYERGLHRFWPESGDDAEFVEVAVVGMTFEVSEPMLGKEKLALGKPQQRGVLVRQVAVREYFPARKEVRAPEAEQEFAIDPDEYWAMHERVVFSLLADALMRGEDAIPGA
ncbi:MAG: AAA family ATPase [Myxococcota bacterium]